MEQNKQLEELAHIRGIMDRSTRFISLSGLSGVAVGILALAGAGLAQHYLRGLGAIPGSDYMPLLDGGRGGMLRWDRTWFLIIDGAVLLVLSLITAWWFTNRRARKMGQSTWSSSAKRLAASMVVPLVAGGLFCLALLWHGLPALVAPTTLLVYGMALLNASKFTLYEIKWLALSELALGVCAAFWLGAGLMFWALGFGVLHILYGLVMYIRYER